MMLINRSTTAATIFLFFSCFLLFLYLYRSCYIYDKVNNFNEVESFNNLSKKVPYRQQLMMDISCKNDVIS